VHNYRRHNTEECREIKKLIEQFHEQQKQQPRRDGMRPASWKTSSKLPMKAMRRRRWSSRMPKG
jgi:hypothetical protein